MLGRHAQRACVFIDSPRVCLTVTARGTSRARKASSTLAARNPNPPQQQEPGSQRWRRRLLPGVAVIGVAIAGYQVYSSRDKKTSEFDIFILDKKQPVSPTASIFYLSAQDDSKVEGYRAAWRAGIWNFQFKQPQIQVVRSYTPLPPISEDSQQERQLRFLIRNERYGEVSNWLHRLPEGSKLELRGPNLEYEIKPQTKHVIFLAGGTGIASALQAAYALLAQGDAEGIPAPWSKPVISILWANRRRDDCLGGVSSDPGMHQAEAGWLSRWLSPAPPPLAVPDSEIGLMVKQLQALEKNYPGQVMVDYFVDAERNYIDSNAISRALARSRAKPPLEVSDVRSGTEILVSGPEGFVSYLAGPRVWQRGKEEQGPVSGVVQQALQKEVARQDVRIWKV
jgi:hypothetical protein